MIAHFQSRTAFLEHPKTASRACAEFLRTQLGFVQITDHHQGPTGQRTAGDEADWERWQGEDVRDWSFIYVVRHPLDTWASWFADFGPANGFRDPHITREFVERFEMIQPGLFKVMGRLWYFAADPLVMGRALPVQYEGLHRNLWSALRKLNVPAIYPLALPVIGRTEHRHMDWRTYYTPDMAQWLAKRYHRDMEQFGYYHERTV
jgi:hypothetical protein